MNRDARRFQRNARCQNELPIGSLINQVLSMYPALKLSAPRGDAKQLPLDFPEHEYSLTNSTGPSHQSAETF